ncbi:MAG: four helix bundle protein [Verrucomicrobia bacterium]|nr:four helix bundle protein [Verrucomicrobiota bacterium]
MDQTKFDLEERLLEFAVRVIHVTESMKRSPAGIYIADQLLRSGTSPYGHHGEAEGAESRDDFIHKLKVCYKELREARRWLRLVQRTPLVAKPELLDEILTEADELVRIFAASIRTAEANRVNRGGRGNAQRPSGSASTAVARKSQQLPQEETQ